METRYIETLVAVADTGSLAQAARQLKLSPAAVAQQVRTLELEVGFKLTTRVGRTVQLTSQGRTFVQKGRELLQQLDALFVPEDPLLFKGELRLGSVATAMSGVLPDMLTHMQAEYPGVRITLTPGDSTELYRKVLRGDIDAALVVEPQFELPKSCAWSIIRSEPLILITSWDTPPASPEKILSLYPLIRYDRNSSGGKIADKYLQTLSIDPVVCFELFSLTSIGILVDRGVGVSLVPDWAPPWPAGLRLRKYIIEGDIYVRRLGLVWIRNGPKHHIVEALLEN